MVRVLIMVGLGLGLGLGFWLVSGLGLVNSGLGTLVSEVRRHSSTWQGARG